ncbi:MAG: sugar phosphate isomerase/epimerase [bacterium]
MNRLTLALVSALTITVMIAPALAERDDTAAEKLGFKLGIQCWTYRMLTTFETLDRCQKFGIKYLEIFGGQKMKPEAGTGIGPGMNDAEIADLLAKAKACGVKIMSFGVSGIPMDEAGMKKHFEWAKKMGLEVLVTENAPDDALDKMSQETGIKIAIHNHPKSWPADRVLAATKDFSKNCGACADTGHWLRSGRNPVENLKLLEGRVVESHFKDLNDKKSDVVFGTGIANVKAMMQELKRQGFKGMMAMEYEHGDLAHLDSTMPLCVTAFDKIAAEVAKE